MVKKAPPAPLVLQVSENAVWLGALPSQPIGAHLFISLSTLNSLDLSDYRFIGKSCSLMAKWTGLASHTASKKRLLMFEILLWT